MVFNEKLPINSSKSVRSFSTHLIVESEVQSKLMEKLKEPLLLLGGMSSRETLMTFNLFPLPFLVSPHFLSFLFHYLLQIIVLILIFNTDQWV